MGTDKGRTHEDLVGRFIVLDGPDGCGKSNQARKLMEWLQGVATAGFSDPGATVIGDKIHEILLSGAHESMTTPTEALGDSEAVKKTRDRAKSPSGGGKHKVFGIAKSIFSQPQRPRSSRVKQSASTRGQGST